MIAYFKIYNNIAYTKGYTIRLASDEIEVTQEEYDTVILPAKKINGEWVASEMPVFPPVDPFEGMTNEEIRHQIYTTEPRVSWYDDKGAEILITVDEANQIYSNYNIDMSYEISQEIQRRIIEAKQLILEQYPRTQAIATILNLTGDTPVAPL